MRTYPQTIWALIGEVREANTPGAVVAIQPILEHASVQKAGADVNASNQRGWTDLIIASQNGHVEVAKLLIDARADASWTGPLMLALQESHLKAVNFLENLKNDEDVSVITEYLAKINKEYDVNTMNKEGRSYLVSAVRCNHLELVQLLISNEANVNAWEEYYGQTPLSQAAGQAWVI